MQKLRNTYGIIIYPFLLLLFTVLIVSYYDYKMITGAYAECLSNHGTYSKFIQSEVCQLIHLRHIFQSLDLIDCEKIEKKLFEETPLECAFDKYIASGTLPFIFGRWIYSFWNEIILPNIVWILICCFILIVAVGYHIQSRANSNHLFFQYYMMGAIHNQKNIPYSHPNAMDNSLKYKTPVIQQLDG